MTYLEPEIKELGRSADNNTLNTRSLIRTLKYVPDINADGSFHGEGVWTVNTHTPTHPPTHTHTHTHTHTDLKLNSSKKLGSTEVELKTKHCL